MTFKRSISVTLPVEEQFLKDVLSTAVEGGIGHWAHATGIVRSQIDNTVIHVELEPADNPEEFNKTAVNLDTVLLGMQRVLANGFQIDPDIRESIARGVTTNDASDIDAEAADCVIQTGVLGDIVYG